MAHAIFFFYPGVVTGSDVIAAEVLRIGKKFLELDFAVTQNIRIRRSAGLVFAQENRKYPLPILMGKINRLEWNIKHFCHPLRHCKVFPRRAVLGIVVLFPVFHKEACDFTILRLESRGSNGRVNPPGESNNDFHFRWRHEGRPLSAGESVSPEYRRTGSADQ